MRALALSIAATLGLLTAPAQAHNGVVHKNAAEAAAHRAQEAGQSAPSAPITPNALFPKGIGGPYALVDQYGRQRDQSDPDGRVQLIFFGYGACEAICSVAMPRIAEAVRLLEKEEVLATPVLITVDPEHDTPAAMRRALPKTHPRYIGLTGDEAALRAARRAFQVAEPKRVAETEQGAPIYAHGQYIYLMDAKGEFLTLLLPIMTPERMAEIVKGYLGRFRG